MRVFTSEAMLMQLRLAAGLLVKLVRGKFGKYDVQDTAVNY
ncbi:hypothetical protein [Intestinibacter sp.]|nr:hypothetical protein [Intestinibacter sp.]MDY2736853.1 hypothetical protein [Intestinibacter sp.]